ncbi:membrane protein [Streptomyces eurocidicus]|uniref:Membrane protein n=2 Tax=Streptomyces eurocidicus TaxID=66423 RepID=A0A2N8P0T8_STREU|nr:helix-turn-helix transcriptional regulator [Streptomyces eurocidicus]MBF6055454.1 helix-turn-helix domain-containing protein [Streptomyces eurocidicus]PNE34624.1 membrane protein [Streptomyces eurocidicus]
MASEFSTLLRRLRHNAEMTQETLAERAGVGVRTIRGLETGERADPRVTTVRLLADALGLKPAEREELLAAAVRRAGPADPPDEPAGLPDEPADRVEPAPGQPPSVWHDALADVAGQLAHAVAARWQREEEQRQVHDPYPLPVRWRPAPEELTDHWANIRRLPAGGTHGPLDLGGRLDEIACVYRRIPSGRLVVLGRPGSGKTILTMRFVLDYLKSRARAEPVPVIFTIGAWDPTALTFRDWLTAQLTRDHPGLAAPGPGGPSLAAALVESGRILPVLDGFDEIAGGLNRPALEALNATTLPLLLTSRPAEYAAAVAETDVLTSAAAVDLSDLTLGDLTDYLPRTTRKARGGDPATTAWDPVLSELGERPHGPGGAHLAAVLTTPLMVTLARAVYSDTPGRDPASLLDSGRFTGPEELEDHLLDNFVAAAYRSRPEPLPAGGSRRDLDPERARYWLGYLAHHLSRLDTPNLEWWRFGSGLRRSTRTLVLAMVICLTIGFVDGLVGTLFDALGFQVADGLVVGLLAGVTLGIAYWFLVAAKDTAVPPSNVGVRVFRRAGAGKIGRGAATRFLFGSLFGLVFGYGYGFIHGVITGFLRGFGLPTALRIALDDGLLFGVVFAVGAGPALALLVLLQTPLDIRSAVNPVSLLRTNRRTSVAQFAVWAVVFGLLVGVGSWLAIRPMSMLVGPFVWNLRSSLKLGVISGLGGALGYVLGLTAWGQWLVFARIWLPLTGRLPWATVAFLEDAYQRGVLRQAGAVYQFRHARLQEHLARTYRAPRAPRAPREPTGPGGAGPAR